jgi:hypothetical protein
MTEEDVTGREWLPPLRERAAALASRLRAEVAAASPHVLDVAGLTAARVRGLQAIGQRPVWSLRRVLEIEGVPTPLVGSLNRLLLAELAARFAPAAGWLRPPASTAARYPAEIERVVEGLEHHDEPSRYEPRQHGVLNDGLVKEAGVLTHRMLPPVDWSAGHLDPWGRVHWGIAFRHGTRQFMRAAWLLGVKTRGFGPFLVSHLHPWALASRKPATETYSSRGKSTVDVRMLERAEIVRLNRQIKGALAGGWLFDPRIGEIAPLLAHVREARLAAGASFFFVRHDRDGSSGALDNSERRRALFEAGEYIPQVWEYVWPRREFLAWAEGLRAKLAAANGEAPEG